MTARDEAMRVAEAILERLFRLTGLDGDTINAAEEVTIEELEAELAKPILLPDSVFEAFKQYMYDCSWDASVFDSKELRYQGRRFVSAVVADG